MTAPEPDDDAALVERCRAGDRRAWAALVQRYQRLVYAIVRRGGLEEAAAADVFQTVFTRLVEHLPRLQQPERLQAWIVTTAKRELWLTTSRNRRTVPLPDDAGAAEIADDAPRAEEALADLQELDRLRQAMDRLDERCRQLLTLLFADERPAYDDIARTVGMPVGSIGPTRARCLGKLRGHFGPRHDA